MSLFTWGVISHWNIVLFILRVYPGYCTDTGVAAFVTYLKSFPFCRLQPWRRFTAKVDAHCIISTSSVAVKESARFHFLIVSVLAVRRKHCSSWMLLTYCQCEWRLIAAAFRVCCTLGVWKPLWLAAVLTSSVSNSIAGRVLKVVLPWEIRIAELASRPASGIILPVESSSLPLFGSLSVLVNVYVAVVARVQYQASTSTKKCSTEYNNLSKLLCKEVHCIVSR